LQTIGKIAVNRRSLLNPKFFDAVGAAPRVILLNGTPGRCRSPLLLPVAEGISEAMGAFE